VDSRRGAMAQADDSVLNGHHLFNLLHAAIKE
jgi:hypothetical protein